MNVAIFGIGVVLVLVSLALMFFDEVLVGALVPPWYMVLVFIMMIAGIALVNLVLPPHFYP